jgi:hypothetical protein
MPTEKTTTAMARRRSDQAALRDVCDSLHDLGLRVGHTDPSTAPRPSADRKYPDQLLEVWS